MFDMIDVPETDVTSADARLLYRLGFTSWSLTYKDTKTWLSASPSSSR